MRKLKQKPIGDEEKGKIGRLIEGGQRGAKKVGINRTSSVRKTDEGVK